MAMLRTMIFQKMPKLKEGVQRRLPYRQILDSSGNNLLASKNTPFGYRAIGSVDLEVIFLDKIFRFHLLAHLQKQTLGLRWSRGI
jgi:hypothetical protein